MRNGRVCPSVRVLRLFRLAHHVPELQASLGRAWDKRSLTT